MVYFNKSNHGRNFLSIDKADCFLIIVFLSWNGVFVGYIVFESFIVASPTVEELKLFGNPLIPFLQSRAWGAPTSTPPKFAELRAIRNWKMPWKGRERSFKSRIPMQMPLPFQRRWKPFETSTSDGHWPKGHYHLKMRWNWRWKEPRSTEELELPNKFCALQISKGPSRVRRPELIRFFRKVRSLIAWPWKLCPKTLVLRKLRILQKGRARLVDHQRGVAPCQREANGWRMYLSLLSRQLTMRNLADAPIIKDRLLL